MPDNRKPLIYGAFPVCRNYTVRAHIRDLGTAKRCGCENRQQHAGPLRRWLHPPHIHPRYKTEARRGSTNDGQLHGASDVSKKKTQKYRRESKSFLSGTLSPFPHIPRVGQGVGHAVDSHFDPHLFQRFCNKKASKTEVFDAFCRVFTEKMQTCSHCSTIVFKINLEDIGPLLYHQRLFHLVVRRQFWILNVHCQI